MTALAGAGFHVVYANPSGSVGYGEDLARRLHGDWGRADSRELLALLDLKTNGRPDRRADRIDRIVAWFRRHL